jgi:hypothetical protein
VFPHPCGEAFERAVANGANPKTVVPDDFAVVRGGTRRIPDPGVEFSCTVGPTVDAAACAVPYGQIRVTTAGAIRAAGGTVEWVPEITPYGTMNKQHVHVMEPRSPTFGELRKNPVPKAARIDGGQ